jgi:6-pyruvoyltetrahydropterin/6-carboxytetrahydropterin synthase
MINKIEDRAIINGKITCTRRLEWDSMHRVTGHNGKCKCFHGHRYVAEITCEASELNQLGMVIDFGIIKKVVGEWINTNWDHTAIFMKNDTDPSIKYIAESNKNNGSPVYYLDEAPTAENIAKELAIISNKLLSIYLIRITKIII